MTQVDRVQRRCVLRVLCLLGFFQRPHIRLLRLDQLALIRVEEAQTMKSVITVFVFDLIELLSSMKLLHTSIGKYRRRVETNCA